MDRALVYADARTGQPSFPVFEFTPGPNVKVIYYLDLSNPEVAERVHQACQKLYLSMAAAGHIGNISLKSFIDRAFRQIRSQWLNLDESFRQAGIVPFRSAPLIRDLSSNYYRHREIYRTFVETINQLEDAGPLQIMDKGQTVTVDHILKLPEELRVYFLCLSYRDTSWAMAQTCRTLYRDVVTACRLSYNRILRGVFRVIENLNPTEFAVHKTAFEQILPNKLFEDEIKIGFSFREAWETYEKYQEKVIARLSRKLSVNILIKLLVMIERPGGDLTAEPNVLSPLLSNVHYLIVITFLKRLVIEMKADTHLRRFNSHKFQVGLHYLYHLCKNNIISDKKAFEIAKSIGRKEAFEKFLTALSKKGRFEKAIEMFNTLNELHQQRQSYHVVAHFLIGLSDELLQAPLQILALPKNSGFFSSLCVLLLMRNREDIIDKMHAILDREGQQRLYINVMSNYIFLRRFDEALAKLKGVVDPDLQRALFYTFIEQSLSRNISNLDMKNWVNELIDTRKNVDGQDPQKTVDQLFDHFIKKGEIKTAFQLAETFQPEFFWYITNLFQPIFETNRLTDRVRKIANDWSFTPLVSTATGALRVGVFTYFVVKNALIFSFAFTCLITSAVAAGFFNSVQPVELTITVITEVSGCVVEGVFNIIWGAVEMVPVAGNLVSWVFTKYVYVPVDFHVFQKD